LPKDFAFAFWQCESMRIAQIAPIIERVPPKKYGGTERVVSALTEELVKRGHDVTLFASGDSLTAGKLISSHPKGLREAKFPDLYGNNVLTLLHAGLAYSLQSQFDIIHDHIGYASIPLANLAKTPTVVTLHGAISVTNKKLYEILNKPHYVAISKAQMRPAQNLNYVGMVYNGLNFDDYPFPATQKEYLLFVGRLSLEKGSHYAIEVAKYLDRKLVIAAKLEDVDKKYFFEYIEPNLSDQIEWVGEVTQEERNKLMSEALCLLHPVTWREPFGLTLIEAMACGCPVVAFNRGSISEIIQNGKTGFVVEDVDEMLEVIPSIGRINRKYCKEYVLANFNAGKMADGYEEIYNKILEHGNGRY